MHDTLPQVIAKSAEPLPEIASEGFATFFDRFGGGRVVRRGEASHGAGDFSRARAAITRRLIAEHGFTVLAVEADWPDAAAVDRYIRGRPQAAGAGKPFQRFPQWMWRTTEVLDLVAWLRHHNDQVDDPERQASFHGLDLYNMSASIAAVLRYLERTDPGAAEIARRRYGCLSPWEKEPAIYGHEVLRKTYDACEAEVVAQCRELHERGLAAAEERGDGLFDAQQNARLVASAERYYRIMYRGGPDSWNLRDRHMFETLLDIMKARGRQAEAIVWAHNSPIGDARHTGMAQLGELNIGQLCREHFGRDAALIGFGTHTGSVAAASNWDGDMQVMRVRPSVSESYERLCHQSGIGRFLLDLRGPPELQEALAGPLLERFIGVIYRPESELVSHYMDATLPRQFDSYVFFDETSALVPLAPEHGTRGVPETFPFAL